jgi:2-iminobutanoate/2-iminopropanoate deaminase
LAGDLVFPCGQIPTDTNGNTPDTIKEQTLVTLNNLESELLVCGSSLSSIVQITVYLCDQEDFADYDAAWRERFLGHPLPPRTTVFVAGFRGTKRIELTAIAAREEGDTE